MKKTIMKLISLTIATAIICLNTSVLSLAAVKALANTDSFTVARIIEKDKNGVPLNPIVAIIGYNGDTAKLNIPAKVNGVKIDAVYKNAFKEKLTLAEVTIPSGIKRIDKGSFANCVNLKKVTLSDTVESVADYAFENTSITSITLPEKLKKLSPHAFTGSGIKSFSVNKKNKTYSAIDGVLFSKDKKTLIHYPAYRKGAVYKVPKDTKTIEKYAFYLSPDNDEVKLTDIQIPKSVTTIKKWALGAQQNILVDKGNTAFSDVNGVLFDKEKTKLIHYPIGRKNSYYVIPEGVLSVGEYAFFKSEYLSYLSLPSSLTTIEKQAFASMQRLGSVLLPQSVTDIGDYAFANNISMRSAYLLGDAPKVMTGAFKGTVRGFTLYTIKGASGYSSIPYKTVAFPKLKSSVTFKDGNNTVKILSVNKGFPVNRGISPKKSGYLFNGWFVDRALTKSFNFNAPIIDPITVYGKFTKIT